MNDISFFLYNMQKYYFHFYALSWLSFGNSPVAQDNVMANGKDSSADQASPCPGARRWAGWVPPSWPGHRRAKRSPALRGAG